MNYKTRFRSSWTAQEGTLPGVILQGRIASFNLQNWTVDVIAQFDRKSYKRLQVGSPYMHPNNGEGIYVVPEVGATCMVCLPGDSSPPFVLAFIMPFETVDDAANDAPAGLESRGKPQKNAKSASFAGGRPRPKPGDIYIKGRDGNFMILHRGGVLQIGASELAQRIYIPIRNQITDFSQYYQHHNVGGSELWGLSEGPSQTNQPTHQVQTSRVFANDKFADIRVTKGNVQTPLGEPSGTDGDLSELEALGIGKDDIIVYEVAVAPGGFVANSGDANETARNASVFRFFFDRKGGAFLRCKASLLISTKKKLKLKVKDTMEVIGEKNLSMRFQTGADIDGGSYTHIKGGIVRLGKGIRPAAGVGDIVTITLPTAQITGTVAGSPFTGVITFVTPLFGAITSGEGAVLI